MPKTEKIVAQDTQPKAVMPQEAITSAAVLHTLREVEEAYQVTKERELHSDSHSIINARDEAEAFAKERQSADEPAQTVPGMLSAPVLPEDQVELPAFIQSIASHSAELPTDLEQTSDVPLEQLMTVEVIEHEASEAVEADTNVLMAELEEGMLQVEAEYVGELLVSMLIEFAADEVVGVQSAEPLFMPDFEIKDDALESSEAALTASFVAGFNEYIEALEPAQAEEAREYIMAIVFAMQGNQGQLELEVNPVERKQLEQELEALYVQLVEYLGIEYDEEATRQFMQSITTYTSQKGDTVLEQIFEYLTDLGTHEFKQNDASLLGDVAMFVKNYQPHKLLGKYTLQVCLA